MANVYVVPGFGASNARRALAELVFTGESEAETATAETDNRGVEMGNGKVAEGLARGDEQEEEGEEEKGR